MTDQWTGQNKVLLRFNKRMKEMMAMMMRHNRLINETRFIYACLCRWWTWLIELLFMHFYFVKQDEGDDDEI